MSIAVFQKAWKTLCQVTAVLIGGQLRIENHSLLTNYLLETPRLWTERKGGIQDSFVTSLIGGAWVWLLAGLGSHRVAILETGRLLSVRLWLLRGVDFRVLLIVCLFVVCLLIVV